MVRRTASTRLICPSSRLSQVGVVESSKSAMNTLAPEFSALMIILRSTGPVISTRRPSVCAGGEQLLAARIEAALQADDEGDRIRREDSSVRRGDGSVDRNACGKIGGHIPSILKQFRK